MTRAQTSDPGRTRVAELCAHTPDEGEVTFESHPFRLSSFNEHECIVDKSLDL
jgi:hypothetical protein